MLDLFFLKAPDYNFRTGQLHFPYLWIFAETYNLTDSPAIGQGLRGLAGGRDRTKGRRLLASRNELSDFLAGVERRAYKQALFAVHDSEAALDLVQDAMIKLAEKYGDKPVDEYPMLFQRILQNTVRDYYRRQKVRSTWTTLLSAFVPDDDEDADPLETLQSADAINPLGTPAGNLEQGQVLAIIEKEVEKLPARQREAFLMRYWEDMDIAETAAAMGCSEGSVKTHCSRATHTLAAALKAKGIEL